MSEQVESKKQEDERKRPLFRISVAAKLCGVHPQTLRSYERMGFLRPAREGDKNRLYSEEDVLRVRQIQRLTRDLGVNLAGVDVILNLLDQFEEMRSEMEREMQNYVQEVERILAAYMRNPSAPVRKDGTLPIPKLKFKKIPKI
ncbi:MAG TPA: MerR family transcriptional regulator [Fimbriimonadales bacterium]|nr:MerR family transcriptional regulator [Fimbriimonadales bacterium]